MRLAAAAGLLALALATAAGAKPGGVPSEAEARAWAAELLEQLWQGNGPFLDEAVSIEAMAETAFDGLELPPGFAEGFVRGASSSMQLGPRLVAELQQGANMGLVGLRGGPGERSVLLRLAMPESGVSYQEYFLRKDPDGRVRVVDLYIMMLGQRQSALMRENVAKLLASQGDRNAFQKLLGKPSAHYEALPQIALMTEQVQAGRAAEALKTWAGLPEVVRGDRQVAALRVAAAQQVSDAEYRTALEDLMKRFPGDGGTALWAIDALILREEWDGALKMIDRLDGAVGGDPYLHDLRGNILHAAGRKKEALAAWTLFTKALPEWPEGWLGLLTHAVEVADHDETARVLTLLESDFGYDVDEMVRDPYYDGFRKSGVYPKWRVARQPR